MLRELGKQFTILDPLRVNEKFNIIKNIKRQTGNTGVSIKQYQSNRKYVGLWKLERSAGIALAFMVPLGFCIESKEYEMVASCIATLHSYW